MYINDIYIYIDNSSTMGCVSSVIYHNVAYYGMVWCKCIWSNKNNENYTINICILIQ